MRGKALVKERMEVIEALLTEEKVTVITGFDGFMDSLFAAGKNQRENFYAESRRYGRFCRFEREGGDTFGYDREVQIDSMGQFSVRGGIIDTYPLTEEVPIRIEFWDDEIDSIRTFDLEDRAFYRKFGGSCYLSGDGFSGRRGRKSFFFRLFSSGRNDSVFGRTGEAVWKKEQGWKRNIWKPRKTV